MAVAPWSSFTVTVNFSVCVSPAFKSWCAVLDMLYVHSPVFASTANAPYVPVASPLYAAVASWSTSVDVTRPVAINAPSSVTAPACTLLLITGKSFVPVIFTATVLLVSPSSLVTVKTSLTFSPAFNSSCALLAVYVHLPSVSIANVPYAPTCVLDCVCDSPASASATVIVPLALIEAPLLLSVKFSVAELTVGTSFVPVTVKVTVASELVIPSVTW